MDFCKILERSRKGEIEIYPDFQVTDVKDLLVRGASFYGVWDEAKGLWSTKELDVQRLVDQELWDYAEKFRSERHYDGYIAVKTLASDSTGSWTKFKNYVKRFPDCNVRLDEKLTFANTPVKKEDYVSRRLGYSLEAGDYSAWDELVGRLYEPGEREKIEWAIGAVVSGDSKKIQKFCVFYGEPGTGKGTIIDVIQKLFDGYYTTFEAKALGSSNNQFATEVFKSNPLVAIQHDGDLSRIEDNTRLNSIVSHEVMVINEKNKPQYMSKANCFLFLGTNRPVKITDAKSGIIRRLIDITPSGRTFNPREYEALMSRIEFQLGAIAQHCLDVYRELGRNYYKTYKPKAMIEKTDVFYNFVEANQEIFEEQTEGMSLKQAYTLYKEYCDEALVEFKLPRYRFREELKNYFEIFEDVSVVDGKRVRSWYSGFRSEKFAAPVLKKEIKPLPMVLDDTESLLDKLLADCPAQYANGDDKPESAWSGVRTTLKDIDTHKVHYIRVPKNHIVIDFDLKNEAGEKDMVRNLEAACKFPPTYAEFSKGGSGVHLHYIYNGDPNELAPIYDTDIEIKVFRGKSALRRRLSFCNAVDVAHLSEGALPKREVKQVVDTERIENEKHLFNLVKKCLRKGNHGHTRPEIDLIAKALEDAYASGISYDISDLEHDILLFAMQSSHQSDYCLKTVAKMKFRSADKEAEDWMKFEAIGAKDISDNEKSIDSGVNKDSERPIVFFDCEVFPNLFLINWKVMGEGQPIHREINPKPSVIEKLFEFRLVGFNNLKYDNLMLYARYLGYNNQQLYDLSQGMIVEKAKPDFGYEAKRVSYTDIYDFSSKKQSLKKWEIELDIHHQELGLPWDQPVPESMWDRVAEYCDNDVIATEAVWNARQEDWKARQMLAAIAPGTPNETTNTLSTRFIFGNNRNPQSEFNYRNMGDLSDVSDIYDDRIRELGCDPEYTKFDSKGRPLYPGYVYAFDRDKQRFVSTYRGEEVGEGGYVYAVPGIYPDIPTQDVSGMHPASAIAEELFGPRYTSRFAEIVKTRILIKHGDLEAARKMLDGKLAPYLQDEKQAKGLAAALKIVVNSVYGLTSAKFDNPFRDKRNRDNIVAKRGALFMINLKHEVQRRGYKVVHIKTDSIKVTGADEAIIRFIREYGTLYGYSFETEADYDRLCLVNDAVYIAHERNKGWSATGAQFQQPYVFKTLFSGEPVEFDDYCETRTVTGGAIYLDMNEGLPDVLEAEEELDRRRYNVAHPDGKPRKLNRIFSSLNDEQLKSKIAEGHDYRFVGRAGQFFPVKAGCGGGEMVREKDGKYYAVTGTKDKQGKPYRWLEAEIGRSCGKQDALDIRYHETLAAEAIDSIERFGSYERFVDLSQPWSPMEAAADISGDVPWSVVPCGDGKWNDCEECPKREGCVHYDQA